MIRALFVGIVIAASAQAAPTGIPLYGSVDEQTAINVSASIAEANKEKTDDPLFLGCLLLWGLLRLFHECLWGLTGFVA